MIIYVYTDGASRSNPGKSASGYQLLDWKGRVIARESFYNGIKTNNQAEYLALIKALQKASEYGSDAELRIYSDSQLMVNQLKGTYKTRDSDLKKLNEEASALLSRFGSFSLSSVSREDRHIAEVDRALNELLDRMEGMRDGKAGKQEAL